MNIYMHGALAIYQGEKYYMDYNDGYLSSPGFGRISLRDISNRKISTPLGEIYFIPLLSEDRIMLYNRLPQSNYPDEFLPYIPYSGNTALEIGTGNGIVTTHLAMRFKTVTTYEISDRHRQNAMGNLSEFDNITFRFGFPESGISEVGYNYLYVDVPEPWRFIDDLLGALNEGGPFTFFSIDYESMLGTYRILRDRGVNLKIFNNIRTEYIPHGDFLRPQYRGFTGYYITGNKRH